MPTRSGTGAPRAASPRAVPAAERSFGLQRCPGGERRAPSSGHRAAATLGGQRGRMPQSAPLPRTTLASLRGPSQP